MKTKFYLVISLIAIALLTGCRSASKLYEKGRYDEAVEAAVRKWQKKPGDPELADLLRQAYRYAVNDHEARIRQHHLQNLPLRWEDIHSGYASLQRLHDAIFRAPELYRLIQPADYSASVALYADKAAGVREERARALIARHTRDDYRAAWHELNAAIRFRPDDATLLNLREETYEEAVTNVVVQGILPGQDYIFSAYRNGLAGPTEELMQRLKREPGQPFTRFMDEQEARRTNRRPDLLLRLQWPVFDIGGYRDFNSQRRVSREIVVKEIVYRPDSIVREYATVRATLTTTRRSLRSEALLQAVLHTAQGERIWAQSFPAQYVWNTEFTRFTGDARALDEADRQLVNRREETPPLEREIARCLVDEIIPLALYGVRGAVNRY